MKDQYGRIQTTHLLERQQFLLNATDDSKNQLIRAGRCSIGRAIFANKHITKGEPVVAYNVLVAQKFAKALPNSAGGSRCLSL